MDSQPRMKPSFLQLSLHSLHDTFWTGYKILLLFFFHFFFFSLLFFFFIVLFILLIYLSYTRQSGDCATISGATQMVNGVWRTPGKASGDASYELRGSFTCI